GGAISGSPVKTVDHGAAAANTAVSTTFTKAEVSTTVAPYDLVGISQLKGSATTPWRTAQGRQGGARIDATVIRGGTTNHSPTVTFTAPVDGFSFISTTAADIAVGLACAGPRPCGTATDANGICTVEYRLQRSNWWSTQCWTPGGSGIIAGFYLAGCGTW